MRKKEDAHMINENIKVREVRLVGDNVEPGVYPTAVARKMAEEQELILWQSLIKQSLIFVVFWTIRNSYTNKRKTKELKAKQVKVVVKGDSFRPSD